MPNSLQIIQSLYADLSQGNISKMLSLIDLHVVIHLPDSLPYGGTHSGREGFIALMTNVFSTWARVQVMPGHLLAAGDFIVAQGEIVCKTLTINKPFHTPFVHVWKMPEEFITEIWLYEWDTARLLDYLSQAKG